MKQLRALVACEYSGRTRDALIALGVDAMSCDLLPTDVPGPHYQGDVFEILRDPAGHSFDLMIAHPPCTFLAKAGARWLYDHDRFPNRWQDMVEGAVFFRDLLNAPIPHVAVENPGMHRWAFQIIGRRADQIVHPWQHGHPESKATGLWLRGLPYLRTTDDVQAQMLALPRKERDRIHYAAPGPDRWKQRSTTYVGIAKAMAAQWSEHLTNPRLEATA